VNSREQDLKRIKAALEPELVLSTANALVAKGDSLELLRKLPAHSVSLILTDPPYHATKKRNIYGDTAFTEDQHYLDWMAEYAVEWRRILRLNGSLFCCCDSSMSARLDVLFAKNFNVLSHIVWTKPNDPGFDGWKGKMKKEALRQWYAHSERILFVGRRSNDVERFYAAADVFLLPTLYEPFGLVILEALASGLPSIVSASAGACELLQDGVQVMLLRNPSDGDEAQAALRFLMSRPEFAAALSANGRLAAEALQWQAVADRIISASTLPARPNRQMHTTDREAIYSPPG